MSTVMYVYFRYWICYCLCYYYSFLFHTNQFVMLGLSIGIQIYMSHGFCVRIFFFFLFLLLGSYITDRISACFVARQWPRIYLKEKKNLYGNYKVHFESFLSNLKKLKEMKWYVLLDVCAQVLVYRRMLIYIFVYNLIGLNEILNINI